jgi:hypothetical protein
MSDQQLNQIVGIAFVAIALLFVIFGVRSFVRRRAFLRRSTAAEGAVVRVEEHKDSEGDITYAPVVQFRTSEGTVHEIEPDISTGTPRHQVGQTLPVRYDPGEPEKARITTGLYNWFAPLLLWGIAVMCAAVGLVFLSL